MFCAGPIVRIAPNEVHVDDFQYCKTVPSSFSPDRLPSLRTLTSPNNELWFGSHLTRLCTALARSARRPGISSIETHTDLINAYRNFANEIVAILAPYSKAEDNALVAKGLFSVLERATIELVNDPTKQEQLRTDLVESRVVATEAIIERPYQQRSSELERLLQLPCMTGLVYDNLDACLENRVQSTKLVQFCGHTIPSQVSICFSGERGRSPQESFTSVEVLRACLESMDGTPATSVDFVALTASLAISAVFTRFKISPWRPTSLRRCLRRCFLGCGGFSDLTSVTVDRIRIWFIEFPKFGRLVEVQ